MRGSRRQTGPGQMPLPRRQGGGAERGPPQDPRVRGRPGRKRVVLRALGRAVVDVGGARSQPRHRADRNGTAQPHPPPPPPAPNADPVRTREANGVRAPAALPGLNSGPRGACGVATCSEGSLGSGTLTCPARPRRDLIPGLSERLLLRSRLH